MRRGLAIGVVLLAVGVVVVVQSPGRLASRASQLFLTIMGARRGPPQRLSARAVERLVDRSVVDIRVVTDGGGNPTVVGTGMILTAGGIILTNNHLVENARAVTVQLAGHSRSYPARILGVDPTADVALLQVLGASGLPPVSDVSGAPRPGTPVIAIGNAGGLGGTPTATTGTIIATGSRIEATGQAGPETLYGMIETTAPLAPGDSGGPLVNRQGLVVGMDTASLNPSGSASGFTGPSFAVPITTAVGIAAQIERHLASGAIYLRPATDMGLEASSLAYWESHGGAVPASVTHGAAVEAVDAIGPAGQAGLVPGDFITALNGRAVTGPGQLHRLEQAYRPRTRVTVSYVNAAGQSVSAQVVLGAAPWP